MNLASAFALSCEKHGPASCLFWGDVEVSYERLFDETLRISQYLKAQTTLPRGARVGLWLKNCPQFASSLFAIWFAGGVVVPINNFLRPREVAYILKDAAIDVLISEAALREGFAELTAERPNLQIMEIESFVDLPPTGDLRAEAPQTETDLAVIIYTSGTTGRPKGAMLTHGNLLHNVESCRQVLQAVSFDRFVVLLPMFHSFMLTVGILLPVIVGGSIVLVKTLHSPKSILQEAFARNDT